MKYQIFDFMHLKNESLGFAVDRPEGNDKYVFLHFVNPVDIKIGDEIVRTAPNACIIYSPNEPCYYAALNFQMLHNWVIFLPNAKKYDPLIMGVPLNTVFYTDFGNKITKSMEGIQWFYNHGDIQSMSSELYSIFFALANERKLYKNVSSYSEKEKFEELRFLIYQTPKNWNINSMASYVHLSRSRFSVKYKAKFGITPIEDLGAAAMCTAKRLLLTTNITIQNIALECGYNDINYFIQKFKKYNGETPSVWRKKNNIQ